jgi:NADH-quinone oxidoreductase subunit H
LNGGQPRDFVLMDHVFEFDFWITLLFIAVIIGMLQGTCAYLILAERKISAWAQDRVGPNRVGPWGLLQPIVDGAKFLLKEEVIPAHVDRLFYLLAPAIALSTAMLAFAVVPFGRTTVPPARPWAQTVKQDEEFLAANPDFVKDLATYNGTIQFVIAPQVDIGIVFVFAVGSLAAYAVVLGGWSSNNKYSFLGALRSSAQLISYEIPMGMSVLGVMLLTGSLNLEAMLHFQYAHGWNALFQPLACILFATAIFAECNRLPFDLSEAEQELVGGYHTEYSALKFGLFFLGEYTHMITTSFLIAVVFFGGWLLPGVTDAVSPDTTTTLVLKVLVLAGKMALFIVFFMLVRWTIPRFRYDQLMGMAWKVLIPLSLANLVLVLSVRHFNLSPWLLPIASILILVGATRATLRPSWRSSQKELAFRGHELPLQTVHGKTTPSAL